ncbi:MAG: alpha/beta fold hydrolase [Ilumatobacteraceae bacterium]
MPRPSLGSCDDLRNAQVPDVTLVGLHGFTQTGRHWHEIMAAAHDRLVARGISAVWRCPDLPGHGAAAEQSCTLDDAVATLRDLVTPGIPTVWAGYSMGGRHLLHLVAQQPEFVDAMVLISTTAGIDDADARAERRRLDEQRAQEVEALGVEEFLSRWTSMDMFSTMPATPDDMAERQRNTVTGLAASVRGAGTGTQQPLWSNLAGIDIATIVLTGDLDPKFTTIGERLTSTLPHAEHRRVADCGHALLAEAPHDVVDALVDITCRRLGYPTT